MKKLFIQGRYLLAAALCIVLATACRKNDTTIPESGTQVTGEKRGIGEPDGEKVTKAIGPEGGNISTPDNAVTIQIPAGALIATTNISIQPITNTNLAGTGYAYRLLPHGDIFQKPVSIKMQYGIAEDSISSPYILGLAYQDSEGVWQFTGGSTIDTAQKTVSFESTHFSDWSVMPWLVLKPVNAVLNEGEELTLEALHYIPFSECNCGDDIFKPRPGLYPVGLPQPLEQQYIGMWNLNGPGTLIPGVNNLALFKAPASIPVNSSATVSLQLKSARTLILVSNITLQSNSWFEMRINGGSWKSYDAAAAQLDAGKCAVSFVKNNEKLSMFFPAATGTYYWDEVFGQATTTFAYWPNGTATAYESNYIKDLGVFDSDGTVHIAAYGAVNGYVTGSFTISPAGYYTISNSQQTGTYTIEGRFRLKRVR